MTRGGHREGSGRPKKENQVVYYERCPPQKKDYLKKCSQEYDKKEIKKDEQK